MKERVNRFLAVLSNDRILFLLQKIQFAICEYAVFTAFLFAIYMQHYTNDILMKSNIT